MLVRTVAPEAVATPAPPSTEAVELDSAAIDLSCRLPVVFLAASGAAWLVLGLLFSLISSIKLHGPGFLADTAWLTIGRIRPAGNNAILYGFASQAAVAVAVWLLCRLGGNRLVLPRLITAGGVIWNAGLTLGILGILAGASTGFEFLEMPVFAWPILFTGYLFMGVGALVTFHFRNRFELYPSQWFLVAALFWFPWVYSAANLLLLHWPVRGVLQAVVNAWFTHSFLWLWLGFVGIAAISYFVPRLLGRHLKTWTLMIFAFWILLAFTSFGSTVQLVGGPVPVWITSAGIAANMLVALGILILAAVWHRTAAGAYSVAWRAPVLRFFVFGAAAFVLAAALWIILGLREVSALTRLTYTDVAQRQLAIHGFIGVTLLGSLYYIVPRVLGSAWTKPARINLQFWLYAGGAALVFVALGIGGLVHGAKLNDPSVSMVNAIKATIPFVGMSTLGYLAMLAGEWLFLWQIVLLLKAECAGCCAEFIKEVRS